mmetsp:Transcript_16085/g.43566  ORF Transcript_16085/g.43566 Transcript_16085/m.43566 type:complete len:298 (+) Transcript_16085:3430-4323(+)
MGADCNLLHRPSTSSSPKSMVVHTHYLADGAAPVRFNECHHGPLFHLAAAASNLALCSRGKAVGSRGLSGICLHGFRLQPVSVIRLWVDRDVQFCDCQLLPECYRIKQLLFCAECHQEPCLVTRLCRHFANDARRPPSPCSCDCRCFHVDQFGDPLQHIRSWVSRAGALPLRLRGPDQPVPLRRQHHHSHVRGQRHFAPRDLGHARRADWDLVSGQLVGCLFRQYHTIFGHQCQLDSVEWQLCRPHRVFGARGHALDGVLRYPESVHGTPDRPISHGRCCGDRSLQRRLRAANGACG